MKHHVSSFVDWFLRTEYFSSWQSENIESGADSRNADKQDRFSRCYDAAENGADGSTHGECIADMRQAFKDWLRDSRRKRTSEYPYRFESAVNAHFDALELWHETNGSLDQEVG
jgi:hypothetical protein